MNTDTSLLTEEAADARAKAQVARWLKSVLENAADAIGHNGYSGLEKLTDAEAAAYARGVRNAVDCVAERAEVCVDTALLQLHGALGERMRRTGSPAQHLKRRIYNKLVAQIRDKRIAMRDEYVGFSYPEFSVLQKRVWKLRDQEKSQAEWEEFQVLERELKACWELGSQLVADKDWFAKHYEKRKAAVPAPVPQAA